MKHCLIAILFTAFLMLLGHNMAAAQTYTWKNVAMGGGGYVTGLVTSNNEDGLMYARTDVGGAYKWDSTSATWQPLLDWIPSSKIGYLGVESIAIDPNATNRLYMLVGTSYYNNDSTAILSSSDYGATYTITNVTTQFKANGNGNGRENGERLQVDPNNSNVLYCGTRDSGLFRSTNMGATWSKLSLSVGSTPNGNGICFVLIDPRSKGSDTISQTIYVGVSRYGTSNLYVSTNGGTTFSAVSGAPSTYMPQRAVITSDSSNLYITYANGAGPGANSNTSLDETMDSGAVYKYTPSTSTWKAVTPSGYVHPFCGISLDPNNNQRLLISTINTYLTQYVAGNGSTVYGDRVLLTTNGGTSWTDIIAGGMTLNTNGANWVNGTNFNWVGCAVFNPFNTNQAWITSGQGVFSCANVTASNTTWTFNVSGIEETVANDLVSIKGGPLMSVISDYGGFQHTNVAQYAPQDNPSIGTTSGIAVAGQNGNVLARVGGSMYYTTNQGTSWTQCATIMGTYGRVAITANGGTFIHCPNGSSTTYYSTNQGTSWTASTGLPINSAVPVADYVNANNVYAYNSSTGGFYLSTNGGASFSLTKTLSEYGSMIIRAVPDSTGNVWIAMNNNGLGYTQNSGSTFTTVSSVSVCNAVGFGKAATGNTYPTIFIYGTIVGVQGVYMSINKGTSWTLISNTSQPYGGLGNGQFIVGSLNTYGSVFMSTPGRGIAYDGIGDTAGTISASISRIADSSALVAFYNSTGGSSWTNTTKNDSAWSAANPITKWKGLTFVTDIFGSTKVQQLRLPSNNLSGSLTAFTTLASTLSPCGTSPLTSLTTLDLSGNSLTGRTDFNLVSNATSASTTTNTVSGSANQITMLSPPEYAVVGWSVQGTGIPANTYITAVSGSTFTLSNNATTAATNTLNFGLLLLNNLVSINLSNNQASGALPAIGPNGSLTANQNITTVNFANNQFTKWASFSTFVPAVNTVVSYNASNNAISGVFDPSSYSFSNVITQNGATVLRTFNLSNNQLTTLASQNWNNITSVNFSGNQLTSIGNFAAGNALQSFNVSNNLLTGATPNVTGTMVTYNVSNNGFTSLGTFNYTSLISLNDSSNSITGATPAFNSNKLVTIYLNRNQFTTLTTPVTSGYLTACQTLDVSNNLLSTINPTIFTASPFGALTLLKLNNNSLTFTALGTKVSSPPSGTVYAPQDTTLTLTYSSPTLTVNSAGGTSFQWYKNGVLVATNTSTTLTATTYGSGTYTATATNTNAAQLTLVGNSVVVSIPPTVWTGSVSNVWTNAGNWTAGVPTATLDATIPVTTTQPTITGTQTVENITINSGATLINNGTLTVSGTTISNNGTINGTGTTILNVASAQTIGGIGSVGNITLNNSSGATIGSGSNSVNITGILTLQNGTLATNGNLVFTSDSTGNSGALASVDTLVNTGSISGNVTVQRYITPKTARRYSYIGSPIVQTISNAWQQQIYITGSGTGGTPCGSTTGDGGSTDRYNSNGFDVTQTNTASMYMYNATEVNGSRYVSVANTKSTSLVPGIGYVLNIRGNRNSSDVTCANQLETATPTAPEAVTLSATGTATMGDVTVALNNPSIHPYTLLANPYPCQLSFTAFQASNSNTYNKMWTYSPFGNGNYTTYSAGVIANGATGYDNTHGNYIASGQAFFVEANASGNVTFRESHKTTGTIPNTQYFGAGIDKLIRVGLNSNAGSLLDEVVVRFDNNGTSTYNPNWDAESFSDGSQTLAVLKGSEKLAIASLPDNGNNDTIKLAVHSNAAGTFSLAFSDFGGLDSNESITLRDKYLSITQDIRANNVYGFNITADTNSLGSNRFQLIITKPSVLPITFTSITANQNSGGVSIEWKVSNEVNIASYQVERSVDGVHFQPIDTVKAMNTNSYSTEDKNIPMNSYSVSYRIKSISADGSFEYSNVSTVKLSIINLSQPRKGNAAIGICRKSIKR